MKKPFEDLDWNIPYLDRSVVDEALLTKEHLFFRKNGYSVVKECINPIIVDGFLKDKGAYHDIAFHRKLLEAAKDMLGDELILRNYKVDDPEPQLYNYWTITAFLALEPNHNLSFVPESHLEFVGTEIGNGKATQWDAQKGDVIILHTCLSHKGGKGLLPLYYLANSYQDRMDLRRIVKTGGWKTLS